MTWDDDKQAKINIFKEIFKIDYKTIYLKRKSDVKPKMSAYVLKVDDFVS